MRSTSVTSDKRGAQPAIQAAIRACRGALASAAVLSGFINVLLLTGSFYMLQVYDRVMTSRSISTLVALTIVTAILFAFMGLFEWLRLRLMSRVGAQIEEDLRQGAFEAVLTRTVEGKCNTGIQPVRDLATVRQFVSGPGLVSLFDVPWAPVYLIVCYLFHPLVGFYALLGALILLALALLNEVMTCKTIGDAGNAWIRAQLMTEEARRSAEVMHAMAIMPRYRERWSAQVAQAQALNTLAADRTSNVAAVSRTLRMFLQSAVLGIGAALAIKGEISPGVMIASSILMARAVAPIDQLILQWRSLVLTRKAYQRLKLMLGTAEPRAEPMPLPKPRGRVTVEPLSMRAPSTGRLILQIAGFALEPGDALGIIGPTGSGKSTLARALVGVWQPERGAVRLDGAALDQWPPEQLGRAIGYLPQDVEVLSGTVQDNIARFEPAPDPDKVAEAARRAHAHDMILQLPDGYGTELGEGGANLSAGQRQRIGLARAFYDDPVLLVLDEPNSNLDTVGEIELTASLEEAREQGTTVIVIAHRRSILKCVNKILVLNAGLQMAVGPKQDILSRLLQPPAETPQADRKAADLLSRAQA